MVVERLVWVNADNYPDWLAYDLSSPPLEGPGNLEKAAAFFDKTCGDNRGQLSVKNKENGIFMRCDDSVSLNSWFKGVYHLRTEAN
ncbi:MULTISPECIES: hypothetical protein [unclassified Cedecea]|uniref:hypothetical protein n=1 Tax=unclassified Cedecea TaxID=2649846 RepID=UPI003019FFA5